MTEVVVDERATPDEVAAVLAVVLARATVSPRAQWREIRLAALRIRPRRG